MCLQDQARCSFGHDPEKSSCEIFQGLIQDPSFLRKGQKNAANSHKTQDILPRSIKSIYQSLLWLIKIIIAWQDRKKCLDQIEQGWPKSYSRSLTLPVPRSFLVTIKCRTNGDGHGQGNFYVQSDGKARGKENGPGTSKSYDDQTKGTLTFTKTRHCSVKSLRVSFS